MANQNINDELLQLRKRARRRLVGAVALVVFSLTILWVALDGDPPKNLAETHPVEIVASEAALSSVVNVTPVAASVPLVVPASSAQPVQALATNPEPEGAASTAPVHVAPASPVSENVLPGKLVNHQVKPSTVERELAKKEAPKPTAKPTSKPKPTLAPKPEAEKSVNPQDILDGKTAATAPNAAGKQYFVQVGAYADAAKAHEIEAKIKAAGVPVHAEAVSTSKGELTRIRIGPTRNETQAKEWLAKLDKQGVHGTLLAKDVK